MPSFIGRVEARTMVLGLAAVRGTMVAHHLVHVTAVKDPTKCFGHSISNVVNTWSVLEHGKSKFNPMLQCKPTKVRALEIQMDAVNDGVGADGQVKPWFEVPTGDPTSLVVAKPVPKFLE